MQVSPVDLQWNANHEVARSYISASTRSSLGILATEPLCLLAEAAVVGGSHGAGSHGGGHHGARFHGG